jgi:hypothetical protein
MVALLVEYLKPVILFVLIGTLLGLSHLGDRKTARQARTAHTQR